MTANAATSTISISDCSASQLVGGETFNVAKGTLSLEKCQDSSLNAVLVLKIGESFILALEEDAEVGTSGDRSYLFAKKLVEETPAKDQRVTTAIESDMDEVPMSPVEGKSSQLSEARLILQVDMPSTASEAELTAFEKCLVDHKFLMVGVQADADNISRSILEWAGQKTQSLRSYTTRTSTTTSPVTSPTKFDASTHNMASSLASGSTIFAETTTKVGYSINAGMATIGGFLGSKLGSKGLFAAQEADTGTKADVKEAAADGLESVQIVGSGVAQGATDLGSATGDALTQAAKHNYGDDAASLSEHARTAAANVGSVGATAFEQSSVLLHGAQISKGALSEE